MSGKTSLPPQFLAPYLVSPRTAYLVFAVLVQQDSDSFRESVFGETNDKGVDEADMSGYLLKKGDNVVSPWQSRWFETTGHYLKYYKSLKVAGKKDYCLAAVDLNLCEITDATGRSFSVVPKANAKATMSLKGADDLTTRAWVEALRKCKYNLQESIHREDKGDNGGAITANGSGNAGGDHLATLPSSSGGPPTPLVYNEATNRVEPNPEFEGSPIPAAGAGTKAVARAGASEAQSGRTLDNHSIPSQVSRVKDSSRNGIKGTGEVNPLIDPTYALPQDSVYRTRDTLLAAAAPNLGVEMPRKDSLSAKVSKHFCGAFLLKHIFQLLASHRSES